MPLSIPVKHSRPERTFDGEGDLEEMVSPAKTLFCDPLLNANKPSIIVNAADDVRIGDLIEVRYNSANLKTSKAQGGATLPAISGQGVTG